MVGNPGRRILSKSIHGFPKIQGYPININYFWMSVFNYPYNCGHPYGHPSTDIWLSQHGYSYGYPSADTHVRTLYDVLVWISVRGT